MGKPENFIVVCQQVWCNSSGVGIDYGWDGERFATREEAISHGFEVRGSDDFNVGVVSGNRLLSFDWMDKPTGEDAKSMRAIADALCLTFVAPAEPPIGIKGEKGS